MSINFDAEGMDMDIDLSNLGTVNTMLATLISKLGVPIKTTISANVLEEALNGQSQLDLYPLELPFEKQSAHLFGVTISYEQAESGIDVRVTSAAHNKFKLLYFEQDANGGFGLALQGEDDERSFSGIVERHSRKSCSIFSVAIYASISGDARPDPVPGQRHSSNKGINKPRLILQFKYLVLLRSRMI
ncbi:Chaperone protein dnaJ 15 [Orobanche minor]